MNFTAIRSAPHPCPTAAPSDLAIVLAVLVMFPSAAALAQTVPFQPPSAGAATTAATPTPRRAPAKPRRPAGEEAAPVLAPAPAPVRGPLPDAALKASQDAERLAAANQPQEAIAAYDKLDREFPGRAALSLRLGQIHDGVDQAGPALFYYRRYCALAGTSAREEARNRVQSLELTAGAVDEAKRLAATRGESTIAVATPASNSRHDLAVLDGQGNVRVLRDENDAEGLTKGVLPPVESTPRPTASPASAGTDPGAPGSNPDREAAIQAAKASLARRKVPSAAGAPSDTGPSGAAPERPADPANDPDAALARSMAATRSGAPVPPSSTVTRTVIRLPDRTMPAATPLGAMAADPRLAPPFDPLAGMPGSAVMTPAAIDPALLVPPSVDPTFTAGLAAAPPSPGAPYAAPAPDRRAKPGQRRAVVEDAVPRPESGVAGGMVPPSPLGPATSLDPLSQGAPSPGALNIAADPASLSAGMPPASVTVRLPSGAPPPPAPRGLNVPRPPMPVGGGGERFFVTRPVGGSKARLVVTNSVPDSILTFKALPADGAGKPANAIIPPGESRTIEINPGEFDVTVNLTTQDYAPVSLLDRRFTAQFAGGIQYTRRLTQDTVQGLE